jgi:hypothetical protein
MGAGGRRVHQQGSASRAPHANAAPHALQTAAPGAGFASLIVPVRA